MLRKSHQSRAVRSFLVLWPPTDHENSASSQTIGPRPPAGSRCGRREKMSNMTGEIRHFHQIINALTDRHHSVLGGGVQQSRNHLHTDRWMSFLINISRNRQLCLQGAQDTNNQMYSRNMCLFSLIPSLHKIIWMLLWVKAKTSLKLQFEILDCF